MTKRGKLANPWGLFKVGGRTHSSDSAWEKLAKALKTVVDPDRFAAFSGTRSLPFAAGAQQRIAVKVIDPRGNDVMRVVHLGEVVY